MDVVSDKSLHVDRFAFVYIKFLQSPKQAMTPSNVGSTTEQAGILHPSISQNDITTKDEEEANSAVTTDVTQRTEEEEEEEEEEQDEEGEEDDDYASRSELESDDEETPQKPQISERRRQQNKTFQSWFVFSISDVSSPC